MENWVDYLGLVAGIMVAVSLVMRSVGWLRPFNLIGCILFVVWGLIEGAAGVWICNGVGVLANIYRMIELRRDRERC